MHWQFIGNFPPNWAVSDAIKIQEITLHLNKHCCQLRQDKTDLEEISDQCVCRQDVEIKNCSITKCHFSSIFALWPFFYGLSFLWRHFFCWMEIGAWCSMQNLANKFVSLHYLYIFSYLLTAKAVCFFDQNSEFQLKVQKNSAAVWFTDRVPIRKDYIQIKNEITRIIS